MLAKLALAALVLLTTISLHLEVVHVPLALALPRLAGHRAAPCASPAAPAPPAAELGRLTRSKRCACKGCAAHAALAYPLPEYFPLAPLPLVMETRARECDLCWAAPDQRPNPCELLSERRVWNPDPHVREALASALGRCAAAAGTCNMLDLGANLGAFALWGWGLGANVVAVEPDTDMTTAFRRTVALNCAEGDIEVRHAGVTHDPSLAGTLATFPHGGFRQCDSEEMEGSYVRATETPNVDIPLVLVDALLLSRPVWDLVKIDIDYHDVDLLARAVDLVAAGRVNILNSIIEWNDGRGYGWLFPRLHALNYTAYKLNVHDNRRVFNARGVDVASNFAPLTLEHFFEEVFGQRHMRFAFKVKKGLPEEAYNDMLNDEIPEFFITREALEEPVFVNEHKKRVADHVASWGGLTP
jgi:FkbM family methyltransferase